MRESRRTRRQLLRAAGLAGVGVLTGPVAASEASPTFVVQSFDPSSLEIDRGETFDASTTILNAGRPGTETVEYRIEDRTVRSQELTLDRSEERDITFEGIRTETLDIGELTHGVYTAGYSRRGSLVVRGTPVFEVSEVRPRLGDATVGEQFSVTGTVTNTGQGDGEQTVDVLVDGAVRDSATVRLDVGESADLTFTLDAPDTPGEYTHTVRTADDDASGALSVVQPTASEPAADNGDREFLFALGGGGSVVAMYGAYRLLSHFRDGDEPALTDVIDDGDSTSGSLRESTPVSTGDSTPGSSSDSTQGDDSVPSQIRGAESTPPATSGGSTVIESAIEDNLDSARSAVSSARRHRSQAEYARALAACYRARTALGDAAEAASEYDPERVAEIETETETVDDLVAEIEEDLD